MIGERHHHHVVVGHVHNNSITVHTPPISTTPIHVLATYITHVPESACLCANHWGGDHIGALRGVPRPVTMVTNGHLTKLYPLHVPYNGHHTKPHPLDVTSNQWSIYPTLQFPSLGASRILGVLCVRVDIVREYEGLRGRTGCGNVECWKARGVRGKGY